MKKAPKPAHTLAAHRELPRLALRMMKPPAGWLATRFVSGYLYDPYSTTSAGKRHQRHRSGSRTMAQPTCRVPLGPFDPHNPGWRSPGARRLPAIHRQHRSALVGPAGAYLGIPVEVASAYSDFV